MLPFSRLASARLSFTVAAAAAGLALTSCSPVVDVTPAKDAANAACAPMMLALPDAIGDAKLRKTNA